MVEHAFRAMGSTFTLLVDAAPSAELHIALVDAEREAERLEGLLSRFDAGSELARLNCEGAVDAGPELLDLVERAVDARRTTGGRFDPTVHDALVAAGYDRSFEGVAAKAGALRQAGTAACGGGIHVDRIACRIELEAGVRLDLGGIAKGWTADQLLARLRPYGPSLVNAGGDIAACGRAWPVGVEAAGLTLAVEAGGLATSGVDRRAWSRGGRRLHHVIDPATGAPAEGDLVTVTAFGATATEAEIAATALLLAGSAEHAAAEADAAHVPAVLVGRDGRAHCAGGLR